jgi:hypothetical protein
MRRMRAAGIDAFGDEVRLLELAAPASLAPDEVVISVHAAGVGNWDEIVRVGEWDVGRRPPLVLGVEAAGVVAAVGEDVTSFVSGDEVLTHPLPLRHQGAWAEWLVAPAARVAPKPPPGRTAGGPRGSVGPTADEARALLQRLREVARRSSRSTRPTNSSARPSDRASGSSASKGSSSTTMACIRLSAALLTSPT